LQVVLQVRSVPPNLIVDAVGKIVDGRPFKDISEIIPREKLREIFYQKVAGYHVDLVNKHAERKGA
jgi:hypothetical protein